MENLDLVATKWLVEHGWDRSKDGAVWLRSGCGGSSRSEKWKLDIAKDGLVGMEYQVQIDLMRGLLGTGRDDEGKIRRWMQELKWDQRNVSEMMRGVIRFKHVSESRGSEGIDDWFDVWGCPENVKLGIKHGMLRVDDDILVQWGEQDSTLESIGAKFGISAMAVKKRIDRGCKKLWKQEMKRRLDWAYTYEVKGDWKTCGRCGEVKLGMEFVKGRNMCRKCDYTRHRVDKRFKNTKVT